VVLAAGLANGRLEVYGGREEILGAPELEGLADCCLLLDTYMLDYGV
jgi:hypothetical protein